MIVQERIENTDLIKTYSDAGFMIEQNGTGFLYAEAIDPDYMNRAYTETDVLIEKDNFIDEVIENES